MLPGVLVPLVDLVILDNLLLTLVHSAICVNV